VPFTNLLRGLVSSVEGATGALVVAADGEAVQWHSRTDDERLRLRSAYLVNALQGYRAATIRMNVGELGHLVISYDGASFVVHALNLDYYLLLEMDSLANVARAVYRIKQVLPEACRVFET